jgi:hypothetical protein
MDDAANRTVLISPVPAPVLRTCRKTLVAAKSSKAEVDRRVDAIARLLINAASTSQVLRFASAEWGVTKRQAETYIARARRIVRDDYSQERADYLASRLAVLDSITQKAIKCGQLSAAVGAVRLGAELTQLLNK